MMRRSVEGYESLVNALEAWFLDCENDLGSPDAISYEVEEGTGGTRRDCAIQFANYIQNKEDNLRFLVDLPEDNQIIDTEILQPIIAHTPPPPRPHDALILSQMDTDCLMQYQDLQMAKMEKENMIATHLKYEKIKKEQERLAEKKEQILIQLVREVNNWSHATFTRPEPTSEGVKEYFTQKNVQLNKLIPDIHHNPTLKKRIRKADGYGAVSIHGKKKKSEVELSASGAICDKIDQLVTQLPC